MKNNDWAPIIAIGLIWAAVILAVSSVLGDSPLAGLPASATPLDVCS
jgi:hypothetical protein